MQYVLVIYMISFIVLFGNFYAKAYIEKVCLCVCYVIVSHFPSFIPATQKYLCKSQLFALSVYCAIIYHNPTKQKINVNISYYLH
jgi:hypothetical protein